MLAPLALLLVLEARCAHFVIAHFFLCCEVVHHYSSSYTAHILDDKLVSKDYITVIAMGMVVPMSKVESSWICYQVYVIQHLLPC